MLSRVLKIAESNDIAVVSTDVFDTLLLRSATSERRRFRRIAHCIAARLAKEGHVVEAEAVFYTRLEVQAAAYRAAETRQPPGDVRLQHIVALQAQLLRIPPQLIDLMINAEVEADLHTLKVNNRLIAILSQLRDRGKRIVAISDTYYSAAHLAAVMSRLVGRHPISHIYASSDHAATKKSGRLYQIVADAEKCLTHRILHIGDDRGADWKMAEREGVMSLHTPRPHEIWARRKIDAGLMKIAQHTIQTRWWAA